MMGGAAIDEERVFHALRRVLELCGADVSRHDLATVLIMACLDEGVTRGTDIVRLVSEMGFGKQHVGMQLAKGVGSRWSRSPDGEYRPIKG